MSDAAAAKPKKVTKPKKPAAHPKYIDMIKEAISSLKERNGSSRQAILKYITANFDVGTEEKGINHHIKLALRAGVSNGKLKQIKGTGAAGSFRVGDAPKDKKPKVKKAKKPAGEKKVKAKKTKTPKKKAAAKPKKSQAKKAAKPKRSPAKKAAKPKRSPAKKSAAKKPKSPKKKPASKK